MDNQSFDLRKMFQGITALGLFVFSWVFLIVVPLFSVVALLWFLLSMHDEGFEVSLVWLIVVPIFAVLGLLLRWIARGILQDKRGRIAFSAAVAATLGAGHLFLTGYVTSVGEKIHLGVIGAFFLLAAIGLFWLLFSKSHQHET